MRTCSECEEKKDESEFYWSNKTAGYKRADCKVCSNKLSKPRKRAWLILNPNKTAEYSRRTRDKHLVARKAQKKVCDDAHRDSINEYNALYRKSLPDAYVKNALRQGRGFPNENITPDLITAERALIKLKRAIKETV